MPVGEDPSEVAPGVPQAPGWQVGPGEQGVGRRRSVCPRCRRPVVVCYCAHLPALSTRTRVLLLQHPRERHVAIGTARMAHLALPGSTLRMGVDFSADQVVRQMVDLARAPGPVCVLFPRPGATDVARLPRDRPVTLVVLDGTWTLARKLLTLNPFLQELPHVAFTPSHPSDYRIRRQPEPFCLSTIEALAEVLQILEPGAPSFEALLGPFRHMVAEQERFIHDVHARRHHGARRRLGVLPRPTLPERLAADWSRLVCVQGEANAWPRRDPRRRAPELIHWVAERISTGARYEAIIAPRGPLADSTLRHAGLGAAAVKAGVGLEEWRRSWSAFVQPGDLCVTWGMFYLALAAADRLELGDDRLDLRGGIAQLRGRRFKTVEDALTTESARLGPAEATSRDATTRPSSAQGRAATRLESLVHLVQSLAGAGSPPVPKTGQPAGL